MMRRCSFGLLWTIISWLGASQGLALTLAGVTGAVLSQAINSRFDGTMRPIAIVFVVANVIAGLAWTRARAALVLAVLAVAGLAAFGNTFAAPFVFDDAVHILEQAGVAALGQAFFVGWIHSAFEIAHIVD